MVGIEQHAVDALAVHHGKPRVRVVAARRAALRVGDLTAGEEPRGVHLDAAERAELAAQRLERPPVDEQHLVALGVAADPDGSVSVRRVDVAEPGVGRLQHVAIRIHHGSLRLDRHGRLLSPALRAITVPYPERSAGAVGRDRTRGEEVAMAHQFRYLFTPLRVGGLTLKNRIYSSGHAEAMAEDGRPGERLRRYHEAKARGGCALTIFGGSIERPPLVAGRGVEA